MACLRRVLPRLTLWILVGLCVAAVMIGHNTHPARREADVRFGPKVRVAPRYQEYGGFWFSVDRHPPRLLDVETGAVLPFPVLGEERLDSLNCSPWRDSAGRFQMVGRWLGRRGSRFESVARSFGLALCTFPPGEIVERVALDPIPMGKPCWYPDGSGRVLFGSGDGRLYQIAFSTQKERGAGKCEATRPQPLGWQSEAPGRGWVSLHDLHWPVGPVVGGRILVSLTLTERGRSSPAVGARLWWLQLDGGGNEVVAAGGLFSESRSDQAGTVVERQPVVGPVRDGTAMLAYLVCEAGRSTWDLWVAPIPRLEGEETPLLLSSRGRKLAEGCAMAPPAFSADGRWVYAIRQDPGPGTRLDRFPLAGKDPVPGLASAHGPER